MTFLTDYQTDRENAIKPFVLARAHRSHYSGWVMYVHKTYRECREAEQEAETLMGAGCVYCRVERWPNADGGEVVVREFGREPGDDPNN